MRDFVSLSGSVVNCAGGRGLRERTWITGEESVGGPNHTDPLQRFSRRHGYCFEVPLDRGPGESHRSDPIPEMGRFSHEAVAVDQRTGIVYETEDPGTGLGAGFYRYLPNNPRRLRDGGRLQMLGIRRRPQLDLRKGQRVGDTLAVTWIDIPNPDPDYTNINYAGSVFAQGYGAGGAKFNRLEGCWYDEGSVFFVSTSGGDVENGDVNADGYKEGFGQVWEYRPSSRNDGLLTLWFESPGGDVLDSPDNVTVTPRGGLMLCEDDTGAADVDTHPARARHRERQPPDRPHAGRRRVRVRGQPPQRLRGGGRLLQPGRHDDVLQRLRRGRGDRRSVGRQGDDRARSPVRGGRDRCRRARRVESARVTEPSARRRRSSARRTRSASGPPCCCATRPPRGG